MRGRGPANEGLRADWQQQLRQVQREGGFRYLRFHGLLHDDMGVYSEDRRGQPVYNWQYIDKLYDFLLSVRVRPFVELSFMPNALRSTDKTLFWWQANVSPPKDYAKWDAFITALVKHWEQRYGRKELESWLSGAAAPASALIAAGGSIFAFLIWILVMTKVAAAGPFRRVASLGAVVLVAALSGCAGTSGASSAASADRNYLVYVGTNVSGDQASTIYLYRLHSATGELTPVSVQHGGSQPSYLTMDASLRHLYAVSETGTFQGRTNSGGVSAFEVNATTGALTLLDQQPSMGASPCYISLDHTGKNALVANYTGGNVALLPLRADGQLAPPAATDQHQPPLGPHKNQDHAHAHCFIPDPANRYAFAVDLGTDKVYGYQLDAAGGQLRPLPTPAFAAKPGAGPRHLIFHPSGRWAYLENELNSTVTALAYDAATGTFREIQTLSTLPEGFTGENSGADVHVSPDGRFLYTSNRGDNSIAVFSIAPADGRLTVVQHVSTQGKTPRNFALDPSGRLLLVANQNSDNIFTYRVNKQSGKLTATEQSVSLPSPMFLEVVPDFTK